MVESIFFNPWVWIIPIILGIALLLTALGIFLLVIDDMSVGGPVAVCFGGATLLILGGVYFGFMLPTLRFIVLSHIPYYRRGVRNSICF